MMSWNESNQQDEWICLRILPKLRSWEFSQSGGFNVLISRDIVVKAANT
jgi:hypothetical protein